MTQIDATGLTCPMPVLRLQKYMREMKSGERVRLIATDPMAAIDVPHFCTEQGHTLIVQKTENGAAPGGADLLIFDIQKTDAP